VAQGLEAVKYDTGLPWHAAESDSKTVAPMDDVEGKPANAREKGERIKFKANNNPSKQKFKANKIQ
jgi:hypothetical protein